jgi:alpha-beta hydrolase superfamily lysophospholipase
MQLNNVHLQVDGLDIAGQLYLPDSSGPYLTVAICHGLPARIKAPDEAGYAELAEKICRAGIAAFIFNFRGTGYSGGNLDMNGWPRDLTAVIDYLTGRVETKSLVLLGFSAGAAVSVWVGAADDRVAAVAACACPAEFTMFNCENIAEVITHFRELGVIRDEAFPASAETWLQGFLTVRTIDRVAGLAPRPLLLVHGTEDDVVDVGQARRLYERAGEPKKLIVVEGVGHRLRHDEGSMTAVIDWLKELT